MGSTNRISTFFWKFIYAVSIIISSVLLINSTIMPGQIQNKTAQLLSIPTVIFGSLAFLLFISFLIKLMDNKKVAITIYVVGIVLQIAFQIYLAVKMQGAQGVDDFDMYLQAGYLSKDLATEWASYFQWAPQNMAATFVFAIIIRLFSVFSSIPASFFVNVFSFICIDIAILCGFLIVRKYKNSKRVANAYFVLSICFMPLYILPLIMYTDVLSLTLLSIGMLAVYSIDDNKKVYVKMLLFLLGAICFALSAVIKMNSLIAIIALSLFIIFNGNYRIKKRVLYLLCIVPIFFIFSTQGKIQNENIDMHSSLRFPYSYWVGVGFNNQTDGTVYKDGIDTWVTTGAHGTYKERDEYNKNYVKESIKKLGLLGLLNLWEKKINVQWSLGAMGINDRGYQVTREYNKIYSYIYGDQREFILTFSQIIYILMLIGYVVYSSIAWKSGVISQKDNFMFLFVIGIVCFHTFIWEVQERYSFLAVIALLVLGSVGLTSVIDKSSEFFRQKNQHISKLTIICILGLIVGYAVDYSKTNSVPYDIPVVSQRFFRTENIVLGSNGKISEDIVIPQKSTKVMMTLGESVINNKDVSLMLKNMDSGEKIKLNTDTTEGLSLSSGQYRLILTNDSDQDLQIPVLKSATNLGLLQNPISGTKDAYLNFFIVNTEMTGLSKILLTVFLLFNIIVIFMSYLASKKKWMCLFNE
jgi:hypothetical protein